MVHVLKDGLEVVAESDIVLPFQIERSDIKGQIVNLGPSIDQVLKKHDYPDAVARLLGELLLSAVLTGSSLKFDGRLSLQTKSDGAISMLVADYFAPDTVRGYAQFDQEALDAVLSQNPTPAFRDLTGSGHFVVVIDQGPDTERYQGVVALEGERISDCVETYFAQSEQLATVFRLAVGELLESAAEDGKIWRGGGIMLQHLPKAIEGKKEREDTPEEIWDRARILLATAEDHELLDPTLSSEELLFRLYHEDGARVFDKRPVKAGCTCSRDRVLGALATLSAEELEASFEDNTIEVVCEFCNSQYIIERGDL